MFISTGNLENTVENNGIIFRRGKESSEKSTKYEHRLFVLVVRWVLPLLIIVSRDADHLLSVYPAPVFIQHSTTSIT